MKQHYQFPSTALFVFTAVTGLFLACQQPRESRPLRSGDTTQGLSLTLPPPALPASANGQNPLQATANQPLSAQLAPATGGMLNPEHGKPGHRCDIAVGAPLPASNTAGTVTQPEVTPITPTESALNPEHGKPGHRCDIAVGAPLTSNTPAPKPTPAPPPVVSKTFNPADTVVAAGYNPQHGKPGHRCDIAVGAKLPEAATAKPDSTGSPQD